MKISRFNHEGYHEMCIRDRAWGAGEYGRLGTGSSLTAYEKEKIGRAHV